MCGRAEDAQQPGDEGRLSSPEPPEPPDRAAIASRAWNGAIALVVAVAFAIQLVLVFTGGSDANSGDAVGSASLLTRLIRMFSYFTIQSNLLVLIVTISLVLAPSRDGPLWRVLHLDALLGIVITGLVFGFVLSKQVHPTGAAHWATVGFHYIAPWAMLLGWLLFGPRPRIDRRTIGAAFIWPVLWIGYTLLHGAATDWYPYPFLDVTVKGYPRALANTGLVVLIALVLIAIFAALDRLPTLRSRRRASAESIAG